MTDFIDIAGVAAGLGTDACRFDIDVVAECESTNTVLMARAEAGAPSGSVLVAERQTAGRGRRGRPWISAPGDSLAFSLFWRFSSGTSPAGLSLAVGLAVARAIEKVGAGGTALPTLKWPNDILIDGCKLGGILIELLPGAAHAAVIGIGINLRLPATMSEDLRACSAALMTRDANGLLSALLGELRDVLDQFAVAGFVALREDWLRRHAFQDCPVRLLSDFAPPRDGVCRGVAADGALLLECDGRIEHIISGEVSLRPAP